MLTYNMEHLLLSIFQMLNTVKFATVDIWSWDCYSSHFNHCIKLFWFVGSYYCWGL